MVALKDFLVKFFSFFVVSYLFFHSPEFFGFPDFLFPIKFFVASASTFVLNFFGVPVVLDGLTIGSSNLDFTIVTSCTGVVSFSIFSALLFATPMKNKWNYVMLSFPFFVFWNVLRVSLTLGFGSRMVDLFHDSFWMLSVLVVLGIYLFVLKREEVYLSG